MTQASRTQSWLSKKAAFVFPELIEFWKQQEMFREQVKKDLVMIEGYTARMEELSQSIKTPYEVPKQYAGADLY